MENKTGIVILGAGLRGLWLSRELVKLGWAVTWVQIHVPQTNKRPGGFHFDDWPWQVGPRRRSKLLQITQEFIDEVLKPKVQDISVQILTPQGPLELSGPGSENLLKFHFKDSYPELEKYFDALIKSRTLDEPKSSQLMFAHTKKIFEGPLSQRWALEWLGSLRRSRSVSTRDWILKWRGELLDPQDAFFLLDDGLEDVVERAMTWAEKGGVQVVRQGVVLDVGIEENKVRGFELTGGRGFISCERMILAASHETIVRKIPRLAEYLKSSVLKDSEKWAWVRCGFKLAAGIRPAGLLEFSSFVIDPYMPLTNDNFGLLKWKKGADSLTVWARVGYQDIKRRSFLMNLTENIQRHLGKLFPWFLQDLQSILPFEEYFHSPEVGHDDLAVVFDAENNFRDSQGSLKNTWQMGPEQDAGLEILSQLATENRLLEKLRIVRNKELKKR